MSYDELAFFNQQLAAMLREGIPLEAALKQLSSGMRTGSFRAELEELQDDLARGTPLADALKRRSLPRQLRSSERRTTRPAPASVPAGGAAVELLSAIGRIGCALVSSMLMRS